MAAKRIRRTSKEIEKMNLNIISAWDNGNNYTILDVMEEIGLDYDIPAHKSLFNNHVKQIERIAQGKFPPKERVNRSCQNREAIRKSFAEMLRPK